MKIEPESSWDDSQSLSEEPSLADNMPELDPPPRSKTDPQPAALKHPFLYGAAENQENYFDDDDDAMLDDGFDNEGYLSRKGGVSVKKKSDIENALGGHSVLLKELVAAVSNLAKYTAPKPPSGEESTDNIWTRLLSMKIKKMDPKIAERFKIHVDTLALEAIEGDWPPKK